jgi:hypothetical protein
LIKLIITSTSNREPMTAAKAASELIPKTAIAASPEITSFLLIYASLI